MVENSNGQKVGRVLWYDPNLANNVMTNPEDLTIKVEFSTYRKGRSIIFGGSQVTNTIDGDARVTFIEGSKVSDGEQPSLSTRYTEAVALEVMNGGKQNKDDFESLGIESIDIEFNTSYQPMIKIKFIDVRGQAILQQGNMSKYRMFFELPYPIFNLKVKGFYGGTVSYCLHMQRWNASFNSTTGNFEIQADFLGYTYAILTDMLLGLIRAAVRTQKGQAKLQNKIGEYGNNSDLVLTIDEMLQRLVDLNFSVKKISEEDNSASQLQNYDKIFDDLANIDIALNTFSASIYEGEQPYFKSDDNIYLCVPTSTRSKYDKVFSAYTETITPLVSDINSKISDDSLKLIEKQLKDVVVVKDITKTILKSADVVNTIINSSSGKYTDTDESRGYINEMLKIIGTLGTSNIADNVKFDIYNLKRIRYHLDSKKKKLEENKKLTEEDTAKKISDESTEILGFEPTIRNIFRVLCINTEIFLEVLREVSQESQNPENTARINEFKKIIGSGNLNIKSDDISNLNIYAWPEYRESKNDKNNVGFVETWLGSASGVIGSNINEVAFVNEMHTELLNVAKFDKDLDEQIANQDAGLDVDTEPNTIDNAWFPISVADTPVDSRMTENPYILATQSKITDDIDRLVLMRTFLLLGVSTYNNKIDSNGVNSLLSLMGDLEAENLIAAARKLGPEGQTLMNEYLNLNTTGSTEYITNIITNIGLKGSSKITNPTGKQKPIMLRVGQNGFTIDEAPKDTKKYFYKYTYIRNEDTKSAYIPVNKNFDGSGFYRTNGDFVTIDELKELSNDIIFVSTPKNWSDSTRFFKNDDGSLHAKIYELDQYQLKTMVPSFGNEVIEAFKSGFNEEQSVLRVANTYAALVETGTTNPDVFLTGFQPIVGNYTAPEFSLLNYQDTNRTEKWWSWMGEPQWKTDTKIDSSLLAFFTEYKNRSEVNSTYPTVGTYLSYDVTSKIGFGANGDVYVGTTSADLIFKKELKKTLITTSASGALKPHIARKTWLDDGKYMKNKSLLSLKINKNTNVYFPFIEYGVTYNLSSGADNTGNRTISLFGSYFYYLQSSDEVRALLFLHTIPWQGVKNFSDNISEFLMLDKYKDWFYEINEGTKKFTRVNSIRTLFQGNGAFIHAPKAWVLFIGGILWRLRQNEDPINYVGRGRDYTLIAKDPEKYQYLYMSSQGNLASSENGAERNPWGMFFGNDIEAVQEDNYVFVDRTIRYLPKQVRDEFVNYFLNWVNSDNGFKFIQKELDLYKGPRNNYDTWFSTHNTLKNLIEDIDGFPLYQSISYPKLKEKFGESVVNNYEGIIPTESEGIYNTILKANTPVMNYIVSLVSTPTIIQNVNPNIWHYDYYDKAGLTNQSLLDGYEGKLNNGALSPSKSIRVRADKMRRFLGGFYARLLKANEAFQKETIASPESEEDQLEQEIFGTSDDKTIKLQIYRKLSAINDKWINGSSSSGIFSQCGSAGLNELDLKIGKKFRTNATETSLIDTFRFVDRAFSDIGDKFYLNINEISDLIRSNYNQSFFDVSNKILSDNNFNFIPLPTFINFNKIEHLATIFTPYSYNNPITYSGTGPSYLCTYVGQTSTNLDLGTDSVYPDDGLSFNLDPSGNVFWAKEASDFNEEPILDNGDMYTPVFSVNYGQQNQNYFKNIKLDQREFSETMESLQIIEQISQTGDKSKPTYAGNNLFEVYQTRSYSAEVEMMGSAMIQPMMYFQLSNIPMFRGAYLIYQVSHKITPHNMVTTFKGNRVKKTKTPLLDKATMYMNLIGTQVGGAQISSRSSVSGTFPPIVQTVIDNGGRNGEFVAGNITSAPIPKITGVNNLKLDNKAENKLLSVAVEPLKQMINDWITWMKGQEFKGASGNYVTITSVFRDYEKQVAIKKEYGSGAATPGTSPHGWGMAVDFQFHRKDGTLIPNTKNTPAYFKVGTNPAIQWLYDHSYMYGWILPYGLRDGAGLDEHWHWEYHGTAAKCLVEKNPNVYGQKINTSGAVKSFVKNPKDSSGKDAVYTGCDYRYIKMADGEDGGGSVESKNPSLKCGKASANDVNSVYPRSKKWQSGPAEVIVKQTNAPTVSVKKLDYPQISFQTTIVTAQQYVTAAEGIIDKLAPNATKKQKKLILVSAFAISKSEQGSGDGFKGFNNNISGVESDGFKVFNKNDVNGYVVATEGGTGKSKKYFSFSNLGAGLVPLISKIMERNMFDTGGGANEWAWRYFRDWNGYGARTKKEYKNNPNYNDCNIISGNETKYNSALTKVNSLTKYN